MENYSNSNNLKVDDLSERKSELVQEGKRFFRLSNKDKAMEHFDAALSIDPTFIPALMAKGVSLFLPGLFQDAKEYFDRILSLDSRNLDCLTYRGICSINRFEFDDAEKYINKSLFFNDQDFLASIAMFVISDAQGKFGDAELTLKKVLRNCDPNIKEQYPFLLREYKGVSHSSTVFVLRSLLQFLPIKKDLL
jgi:tetratricopeptide (TPR) repeat protein